MSKPGWKDATSYGRGQRGQAPQTAWEMDIRGARLLLSCGHRSHPGEWIITFREFGIVERHIAWIGQMDAAQAQAAALKEAAEAVYRTRDRTAEVLRSIPDLKVQGIVAVPRPSLKEGRT